MESGNTRIIVPRIVWETVNFNLKHLLGEGKKYNYHLLANKDCTKYTIEIRDKSRKQIGDHKIFATEKEAMNYACEHNEKWVRKNAERIESK